MKLLARVLLIVAVFALFLAASDSILLADDGQWPTTELGKDFRGPGFYLSTIKIIACWLLFLLWVHTTDWVSIDAQELKLNYLRWNPIVFGVFMGAFVLVWLIPFFWVAFPLLFLAYVVPLTCYIVIRNKSVDNNQQVLTPEHLRYWFATHLNKLGLKINVEKPDPHESGPPVKVFAKSGIDERTDAARLLMARQSPGLRKAREILNEGLEGRASAIMLDYTQQGVIVRTMVDGMWILRDPKDREFGDPALESLKLLCGLKPQDRQSRQQGQFITEYNKNRLVTSFTSQGIQTGERVVLQFEDQKVHFKTLEDLGMRQKMQEQIRSILAGDKGFAIFSAIPDGGLTSTMDVVLHDCDRYVREFACIEDEAKPYQPVENIPVTTYKGSAGQSPADVLTRLLRTEPHVIVIRDLVNAATVSRICEEVDDNRVFISTVRAKDCAEALLRVLVLGVQPSELAKAVTLVVNQRLVRKLCESCKEPYAPTPDMLRQLGIPAGRVQAFYRPPTPNPEEPKEPCKVCGGIGYFGRTAIFEMLVVGDAVRKALATTPKIDAIRQAARKDGMMSLQEEGVLLVARGVTSLPELLRVMKT